MTDWKYRITTGKTPMIAAFIMLALFGGMAYWLYATANGAFLFMAALSGAMLLAFGLTVYRYLTFRLLIGENGFYYRSNPRNGREIEYAEVEKAWQSSGREQSGTRSYYCNISLTDGTTLRIPYYPADEEAVEYLCEHAAAAKPTAERDYVISGRHYGKAYIVIAAVLLAMFAVLCVMLANTQIGCLPMLPGAVLSGITLIILTVRYRCFTVRISKRGFYLRTTPSNGQHYDYSDIVSCREIEKVVRHRGGVSRSSTSRGLSRSYYYYFEFTTADGETRKFLFEKPLYSHEVEILLKRCGR